MTIQRLKELLNQYPDESLIMIADNASDFGRRQIISVTIEYIDGDDYSVPEIILN